MVAVAAERDLAVQWQPISLLLKNQPSPDSEYYPAVKWSYGLLRVLEAVRVADGEGAVGDLYTEYGRRIHHDGQSMWDVADALAAIGLDAAHAAAFDDESYDAEILRRHEEGLALVGNDVGTPIISLPDAAGTEVAIFGPVITSVPPLAESLELWDVVARVARMPQFFELKRTRTSRPEFGPRP